MGKAGRTKRSTILREDALRSKGELSGSFGRTDLSCSALPVPGSSLTGAASLQRYYRDSDDFHRYSLSDPGRVAEIRKLVRTHSPFLGRRVLDFGCGGGILGFLLEDRGGSYLGVDANPEAIREARTTARRLESTCKFVTRDVARRSVPGTFDTVALLGNVVCHLTTGDVGRMLRRLRRNVGLGASLIVEYRDVVALLADRKWTVRGTAYQSRPNGRLRITGKGVDTQRGVLPQTTRLGRSGRPVGWAHAIWSPFILETIALDNGWKLARRTRSRRDRNLFVDVYQFVG